MKIAITGATGLIGRRLVSGLVEKNHSVIVLSRSFAKAKKIFHDDVKIFEWNPYAEKKSSDLVPLENLDSIIHLAGENVIAKRWTDEQKKNILNSRVQSTAALFGLVSELKNKPKAIISASAVGFYDNSIQNVCDENSSQGNDFLSAVTSAWENEVKKFGSLNIREVRIRIGIVLDKNGGALARLLPLYNFFLGGSIGSGNQWFPWIHIDDLTKFFITTIENENYSGAYNAVSPGIVTMKEFSKTLGRLMSRPSLFSVPEFALKILLGESADTLVKGAKIIPKRTLESGFMFNYVNLDDALKNLLEKN